MTQNKTTKIKIKQKEDTTREKVEKKEKNPEKYLEVAQLIKYQMIKQVQQRILKLEDLKKNYQNYIKKYETLASKKLISELKISEHIQKKSICQFTLLKLRLTQYPFKELESQIKKYSKFIKKFEKLPEQIGLEHIIAFKELNHLYIDIMLAPPNKKSEIKKHEIFLKEIEDTFKYYQNQSEITKQNQQFEKINKQYQQNVSRQIKDYLNNKFKTSQTITKPKQTQDKKVNRAQEKQTPIQTQLKKEIKIIKQPQLNPQTQDNTQYNNKRNPSQSQKDKGIKIKK